LTAISPRSGGGKAVAIGSTHYVQIDRGDVVIAAIQKVLDAARSTSKKKTNAQHVNSVSPEYGSHEKFVVSWKPNPHREAKNE
jgi:hypothetical protein